MSGTIVDTGEHTGRGTKDIMYDFSQRLVLTMVTSYARELKKSAFTIMNYLLPQGIWNATGDDEHG